MDVTFSNTSLNLFIIENKTVEEEPLHWLAVRVMQGTAARIEQTPETFCEELLDPAVPWSESPPGCREMGPISLFA